jgi:thymidylate synthase ThyX
MTVSAKVIKDSISPDGIRITTLELEYPRIIHSELMTHRVFSRNSASSRAIPVSKVIELVENNPAMPVHWGKNQAGMQAKEELDDISKESVRQLWLEAARQAVSIAKVMADIGAHKQVVNRILEPFQHMKVVVTSTEWANWDWLRDHPDADPTIHALARESKKARDESVPFPLKYGEWHLPYVNTGLSKLDCSQIYYDENHNQISLEQARMISASCCAQTSYRKQDGSLEKAEDIFKKLVESEPCHASPVEHQATPIEYSDTAMEIFQEGVTHRDKNWDLWSANFRGWVQFRQLIPNNAKHG